MVDATTERIPVLSPEFRRWANGDFARPLTETTTGTCTWCGSSMEVTPTVLAMIRELGYRLRCPHCPDFVDGDAMQTARDRHGHTVALSELEKSRK